MALNWIVSMAASEYKDAGPIRIHSLCGRFQSVVRPYDDTQVHLATTIESHHEWIHIFITVQPLDLPIWSTKWHSYLG